MFTSCQNKGKTAKTFCDTTCITEPLTFKDNSKYNPTLTLTVRNCNPDSITWTHDKLNIAQSMDMSNFLKEPVRLNKSAVNCVFQDTSYAWLSFNDCFTGRGYLLKLPFRNAEKIQRISGALNSFDPKFSIDPDLRAYTDRGSIYVVNVKNGNEAQMTFKEAYDIDFNDIHKVVDTVNITKSRIYAKLLKDGKEVPFEKNVSL
jgi:hypothetical protein